MSSLKAAIRELNAAGIETWLDVVYNHTAEGDLTGPTLSFRGIDNASYYKAEPGDPPAGSTAPAAATPSTSATRG